MPTSPYRYAEHYTNNNNNNPQISTALQNELKLQQGKPESGTNDPNMYSPLKYNDNVLPYPQLSTQYEELGTSGSSSYKGQFGQSSMTVPNALNAMNHDTKQLKPEDLLPIDDPYNKWNLSNPQTSGSLMGKNFLDTAYNYGIDTISNTHKNPNMQIRSDPIIQKIPGITKWNESSYAPDLLRKQFEIGSN
jgi:hypothetical protein